jgi:release factor glutamine methyltransferase
MLIREALAEASAAGVSALDASLLLAEVLNMNRSSLIAADFRPLDEAPLAAFRALIKRRLAGECVAYIVGRKEFYGLDFQVNPAVLVPRPDTETLVETALEALKQLAKTNQPLRALDLCTGSGAIAIALKHIMPELEVWAADISAEALEVARANAARLLPPDSIHFCHGDLFDGEQHSPFPTPHFFHLIVSNPPYIPTGEIAALAPEVRGEPLLALDGGSAGLDIIRRIIADAPRYLCPPNQGFAGALLLEADPRQMERIAALLSQAGGPLAGFTDIQTRRDLSGAERVIMAYQK